MPTPRTWQIGEFGPDHVPVFLTIQGNPTALRQVIAELVARQKTRFLVLAPTGRWFDGAARELLEKAGAKFAALEALVVFGPNGKLQASTQAKELLPLLTFDPTQPKTSAPSQTAKSAATPRYALRQGSGVWELVFNGQTVPLEEEKGLRYADHLLKHCAGTTIHGVELAALISGNQVLQEASLRSDNATTLRKLKQDAIEQQEILNDPSASESEKAEAREKLEELADIRKAARKGEEGNAEKTVKAVRKALQRFQKKMAAKKLPNGKPHPVFTAFADHFDKYVLQPSARYSGHRDSRVRAGVAGTFTYEPPPGVTWAD